MVRSASKTARDMSVRLLCLSFSTASSVICFTAVADMFGAVPSGAISAMAGGRLSPARKTRAHSATNRSNADR